MAMFHMIAHLDGEEVAREVLRRVDGLGGLKIPQELMSNAIEGNDGTEFCQSDFESALRKVSRKIVPK